MSFYSFSVKDVILYHIPYFKTLIHLCSTAVIKIILKLNKKCSAFIYPKIFVVCEFQTNI